MGFLKRYLFDYLMYGTMTLLAFLTVMWFYDGIIVYSLFLAFALFAVLYVPLRIKWDFKKYHELFKDVKKVKNGEITKKEFLDKVISVICDETGAPEMIISFLSNNLYQKVSKKLE